MTAMETGADREVRLPQGPIRYREHGEGDPVVFVHGLLVNGLLWRKVTPELAGGHRCIVPDWPLGSHGAAMDPDADLSPPGLARLIADFLAALDLQDVTLVGNDTGGALCQLVVASHPDRIGRLVLTPCDAFENFPPKMFRPLLWAAAVPGALLAAYEPMRIRALRRAPMAFGRLAKRPIDDAVLDAYVEPVLHDAAVRRDATRVLRGIHPRHTLDAAARLGRFERPVLIAWPPEDRFFPYSHAERLGRILPAARVVPVRDSLTFVPEDQPARLAELIDEHARERGERRAA
jgi:pimeloyl-ACP methyl ester carboxylesterase